MIRLLKLSATVLLMVLVVFLFAGCGGDSTPTAAKTSTAKVSKASTGASGGGGKAEDLIGQVIVGTAQTPAEFTRSLESRRPIVVTFYMTGPYDDSQVRSHISSLQSRYRGQVDFYDYLITDGQRYGDLSSLLKVNEPPTVVCINRQAQVVRAWTGYVDTQSLEQGIVEALK
ncbi:MAG: hypothetical protein ACYC6B_02430 [Thermoleophilia bacterium]